MTSSQRTVAYRFRAYPNSHQAEALRAQLAEACRLYNAALQERRDAWRMRRETVTLGSQSRQLTEIRAAGDIGIPSRKIASDVLRRVDVAFRRFFQRVKKGHKRAGYPRFRPLSRYDSIGTHDYNNGMSLLPSGARVLGVAGPIKVKQHRGMMGEPFSMVVKREGLRWFVVVTCRQENVTQATSPPAAVGLDVGLSSFIATSEGCSVEAPRFLRSAERRLRVGQRKLSRAKRGSRRRQRTRGYIADVHRRVRNKRLDFSHKLSRQIVDGYGFIAVEKLNIAGMARSILSKSIHDAGWRLFLNQLAYKAAWAGRTFVEVDPAGTSQTCVCGHRVPKSLKDRWHECSACGLSAPRDVVSAQVILDRGRRLQALTGPIGAVVCVAAS